MGLFSSRIQPLDSSNNSPSLIVHALEDGVVFQTMGQPAVVGDADDVVVGATELLSPNLLNGEGA